MPQALLWFRRDLRLSDNPALHTLLEQGFTPVPAYIHNPADGEWAPGTASNWWLHHSLAALRDSLKAHGSDLLILAGDPHALLPKLSRKAKAHRIAWNRCYEPAAIECDRRIKRGLEESGCEVSSHNAALLREPWQLLKKDDTPYRVFTPFWKALYAIGPCRKPAPLPQQLPRFEIARLSEHTELDALELLPATPWDAGFHTRWRPGEDGAWAKFVTFRDHSLQDYPERRDFPADGCTSHLSPHLHFGEISPVQAWHTLMQDNITGQAPGTLAASESWLREIAWREFSYHLLYHFPATPTQALDERFRKFPWRKSYSRDLRRWQCGKTGIPLVDAGMRELWETGYMHNRVRMIAASFLTKNLLIPWQEGARWFWDTLVDADLANNTMGWQWTSGCGADAAPYFRIFNPVLQGEKFDRVGEYVRRWVPELRSLEARYVHKPWSVDPGILAAAGIRLGDNYPQPIVDLQRSRERALEAWRSIK